MANTTMASYLSVPPCLARPSPLVYAETPTDRAEVGGNRARSNMLAPNSTDCALEPELWHSEVAGWILLFVLPLSMVPQYLAIVKRGSLTLSGWSVFLGCIASHSQLLSAYLLSFFRHLGCCADEWSGLDCASQTMGFFQLALMHLFVLPVLYLYQRYSGEQSEGQHRRARLLWRLFWAFAVLTLAATVGIAASHNVEAVGSEWYGKILGGLCRLLSVFLLVPQIARTYRAKESGALSILTLAVHTPIAFLFTYYEVLPGHEHWTAWVSTGCLTAQLAALLALCLLFDLRNWLRKRRGLPSLGDDGSLISPGHLQTSATTLRRKEVLSRLVRLDDRLGGSGSYSDGGSEILLTPSDAEDYGLDLSDEEEPGSPASFDPL